ncbi:transposase IS4 family protein [Spirochaeta thermophila DSM 6578]|uniref:Transposase IS4 family protein n=1 Tax=Winmispira thermophila (strain ATCC 700085 / DSM 6578 / Z-1203) TaxID=869211 RepID=G0GDI7_WINT7|nr:transposase IS4 family protein [Spirochaeta thermophila DSM 6578]
MASIAQKSLFCWHDVEALGDLHRLRLVLENLPDEELMQQLEQRRGRGRNEYPVRAMWNSLVAGIVFQHPSIEQLRRELLRNGQLRDLCGCDPTRGSDAVPSASAYSRFLSTLRKRSIREALVRVFTSLVDQCYRELPGFGRRLGADGKGIASVARRRGKGAGDRRGEHDADWGCHEYVYQNERGEVQKSVKKWFGFTVHLLADTEYELPVAFTVSRASKHEVPVMRKLIRSLDRHRPHILKAAEVFTADRGYDDGTLIDLLWHEHRIKPVIDIRNLWKDGEETKLVAGTPNVVYDYQGTVSCVCMATGTQREMAYRGFEEKRGTLKYGCPAVHYGYECAGKASCPLASCIRIPLSTDRRVFTPLARSSYRWKREYAKRTALERIHSRLDRSFSLELHTIRGQEKLSVHLTLVFSVMSALALGRVRENQPNQMRSLVRPAA